MQSKSNNFSLYFINTKGCDYLLQKGCIFYSFPISNMPAPAPPAAENGAPKTELQELQLKATQVTDEVISLLLIINTTH